MGGSRLILRCGTFSAKFFSCFENRCFRWGTRGLVCLRGRGKNSVHFASLVEVVAAHTAENESSQVCLCFLKGKHVCMHYICIDVYNM